MISGRNTNYLVLWWVIASAVAVGNLASNFITASYAEAKAAQALADTKAQLRQQAAQVEKDLARQRAAEAQSMEAEQAQLQDQLRAQRRQDPVGQQLSRDCAEWTRADASMHSYTTQSERNKHCSALNRYLEAGTTASP